MMRGMKNILAAFFLFLMITTSGVYATWQFSEAAPQNGADNFGVVMNEFTFAPKETLHITAVSLMSSNNASSVDVTFAHPTYITSTATSRQTNGTVTYKVTVFNNTGVTYWYLGPSWADDVGANGLIGTANGISVTTKDNYADNGNTFNTQDWVPPYTTRDFYITYTYGWNAVAENLTTLLSLDFGMKMDAVYDGFLAILNDTVSATGYYYLTEYFDQRYKETGETTIANVGEEDEAFFNTLFGGAPTVKIDGQDVPVTLAVQRANVDKRATGDSYGASGGPTGCEYTLYLTIDELNSPTGEAIVYAISYSRGGEGNTDEWYQLGQLYDGKAPRAEYGDTGEVAIDITKWEATPNDYEIVDGYYYKAGYEQGDQYAKYKKIEELMSANDQNFYNDIDNSQLLRKVYAIVYNNSNTSKPGYEGLRYAFEHAAPFYNVHNNGQEVKVKRIAPRAELIPYMQAIQKAYDYYNQVNP